MVAARRAVLLQPLLLLAAACNLFADQYTIFAFDDHAIPYKANLKLTLVQPEKYAANPVVRRGPPGSVDAFRAQFYGSVIRVGGKFRMWYLAGSDAGVENRVDTSFHVAYAESDDGLHWNKPELGLTSFRGSKRNNLVGISPDLDMRRLGPLVCFVLYEPEEKDVSRRYKMALYGRYYESDDPKQVARASNIPSTIFPLFSADGLRWRLAVPPPKGPWFVEAEAPFPVKNNFELGGLYKFDGIYYAAGQEMWPDISLPDGARVRRTMVTHWSGDFVRWSHDRSFSFQRYGYRSPQESLEEAHEPAGVWNRGNVLVGLYGLWHGARAVPDRRMDLGLLVSNNGIHFREPVPDFVFLKSGRDGEWDQRGLVHGQGYENVGEQTYIYYGSWDLSQSGDGGAAIGLARMRRDGFGFLSTREAGDGILTTAPIPGPWPKASLYLNVDGLGEDARLMVELIGKLGEPIAGYAGTKAAVVHHSGLRVRASWRDQTQLPRGPFRVRMKLTGPAAQRIKVYAAYLE